MAHYDDQYGHRPRELGGRLQGRRGDDLSKVSHGEKKVAQIKLPRVTIASPPIGGDGDA
jgi:hypothetical protein